MENQQNIFSELFLNFVFSRLEAMYWCLLLKLVFLINLMDVQMAFMQIKLSKNLILSVFKPFYIYPSFATTLYLKCIAPCFAIFQCVFNVYSMCIQCMFNVYSILIVIQLTDTHLLTYSHPYPKSRDAIASKKAKEKRVIHNK